MGVLFGGWNMNREGWIYLNDIYPTIQGEGVMAGTPVVMIRFHGCSVGCPWCDTKETWAFDEEFQVVTIPDTLGRSPKFTYQSPHEISCFLVRNYSKLKWVLLSGGEPADQDLGVLVAELKNAGYKVAIETSGTATGHLSVPLDWVTVSPKFNMPGGREVIPDVLRNADEVKHVIGKYSDVQDLANFLRKKKVRKPVICLQPVSQSIRATELAISECLERGWRLSIQIHKYLEIP
jgi:7-carboxy-7-deazaguanine synthase